MKHLYDKELELLKNQEKSVKKLTIVPCGDEFPSCMFIKDSHIDKSKIPNQKLLVENTLVEIQNIEKTTKKLLEDKIQEKVNKYNELDNKTLS